MLGYILIKKNEYKKEIEEYKKEISNLQGELTRELENHEIANKEIIRLTSEISAQIKDCKIGPWCNGCKHKAYASTGKIKTDPNLGYPYCIIDGNDIQYCKKHLNSLCPEREQGEVYYLPWVNYNNYSNYKGF